MNKLLEKYRNSPMEIKASLWFLICSFLQKGISFITTPIFTRLMSVTEYGTFGTFNSWMNIVMVITTLDLCAGVYIQGIVKYENERKKFTSSIQGLTFTLVSIWSIIYTIFHEFFNELLSLTTLQMYSMLFIVWSTSVYCIWAAEQRVLLKYKNLVLVTLIVSFLQPLISIQLVVFSDDKVFARILGTVLVNLIIYSGIFFYHLREGKQFFSSRYWKYALVFNIPLIPHFLSQTVLNSSDRIMINMMVGEDAAGIYTLGYSIAFIMGLFNTALAQTINPWILKKIRDEKTKDIPRVAYLMLVIIGFLNLLLIAFAPDIVSIFAPKAYYDAIWIIPPIAMSQFFIFMSFLFVNFEMYYEKTIYITLSTLASALLNIILNYIFINEYGYFAAGYTTLIGYIVYAGLHFIFLKRILAKESKTVVFNVKIILLISVLFILAGFLVMNLYKFDVIRYIVLIIIVIISIVFRERLLKYFKELVSMRKER